MKHVLYLIKKMSYDGKNPWLFDDLIDAVSSSDIRQSVFLMDFSGKFKFGLNKKEGHDVYAFPILFKSRYLKLIMIFFANFYFMFLLAFDKRFKGGIYTVSSSIASFFIFVHLFLKYIIKPIGSVMIIWDFFPIHHIQISHCPKKIEPVLKALERVSILCYHSVGLMSPKNIDFFNSYFLTGQDVFILPVWGKKRTITYESSDFSIKLKCIFGGQITHGRGIEELINLSLEIDRTDTDVEIEVFGDGALRNYLIDKIETLGIKSLKYSGMLSREEYLKRLSKADVGLIITVPNVTVPTYPSKVIDYLVASKPILAIVENTTDFGEIIEFSAKCGFYAEVNDVEIAVEKLNKLHAMKKDGSILTLKRNSMDFFSKEHDVDVVKLKILDKLGCERKDV
ncbi:TPA: hypothetical protein RQJ54_004529 [Vibrio vulnificus]|nr:hypothetical protein [Vibrio vulnificus]